MKNLKHKILETLNKTVSETARDRVWLTHFVNKETDKETVKAAFEELDQAGHGVYTRTLEGISLAATDESKKAFEDGVYLEKEEVKAAPVKKEKVAKPKVLSQRNN
ncbi:hypothetical protein [Dyadobacter bucti]|uniref:hypothetical protein n=1 Tax=Dyadobacter bucti TaxID=2572203 RepID=UPI0011081CAE|nr:hypothetical protein [Dyadobacter bucti]